jgi:hypothetical protein
MKRFALVTAVLGSIGLALAAARGNEPAPVQQPPDEDAMARWMATIAPGEQHELLKKMEGEWDAEMNVQGMVSKGTSTSRAVLGGRFIMSEFNGDMMGQPWENLSFLGFDRYKNKFVGCQMSTMGTNILAFEGLLDQTGDVITLFGPMDEPMTNEHDKTVKYVYRFVDENTMIFEVHDLAIIPGETKVVEVKFTRKSE